jgi:hypothetical protein
VRIFLGFLTAVLTIAAAGFGVTRLVCAQCLALREQVALSWLVGTAVVSLSLWLGGIFFSGAVLQLAVATLCVIVGAVGFITSRKQSPPPPSRPYTPFELVLFSLFLVELLAMFWIAFTAPLEWDGLLVWEIKARYAFLNGGVVPPALFHDASRWFCNPDYPLELPLTELWFYQWLGEPSQFWIKLIFPMWYGAAMLLLASAGEELSARRWIGWLVVGLFPLIPVVHSTYGGFQVGYADAPLSAIYLAAVLYLLRFWKKGDATSVRIFVLLAATLPWMKPEGVMLWGVASVAGAVLSWRKQNLRLAIISFLPGLCVIVGWRIFLHYRHVLPPQDFLPFTPRVFWANLDRARIILPAVLRQFVIWGDWRIFWIMVGAAIITLVLRKRNAELALLGWLILLPLLGDYLSYFFSNWEHYSIHINTSIARRMIEITPLGWLFIAAALGAASEGAEYCVERDRFTA